jgi:hypothetical protein
MTRDPIDKSRPGRYYRGLTEKEKKARKEEFDRRKKAKGFILQASDRAAKKRGIVKSSIWTRRFKKYYPNLAGLSIGGLAKKLKIPKKRLQETFTKGVAAWKTSGSRPGATASAWGVARMHKFIMILQRLRGKIPGLKKNTRYKGVPVNDPDEYLREGLY